MRFFWGLSPEQKRSAALARKDVVNGLLWWRSWTKIALYDIRRRYQRTMIGPLWLTISMGTTILGLGLVFSALFGIDIKIYLPYLAVGLAIWSLILGTANDASTVFIGAQQIIMSFTYPMTAHIYRTVLRNFIVFLHNMAAVLIFLLLLGWDFQWQSLLSLVGLVLLLPTLCFCALIVSVLGTRFRDIQQIISTGMNLAFFLTPIFWQEDRIAGKKYWVEWNPFYHFIEVVRAPILGKVPDMRSYLFVVLASAGAGILAYFVFRATRKRIPYWL